MVEDNDEISVATMPSTKNLAVAFGNMLLSNVELHYS